MQDKKDATRDRDIDTAEKRNKVMMVLNQHIGAANAVPMTELFEIVFERPWSDRINDTRPLRILITKMRDDGIAICSLSSQSGGGYYQPAAGSELVDYLRKDKYIALKKLGRDAKMLKITLPDYLGQLKLEMENKPNDQAA